MAILQRSLIGTAAAAALAGAFALPVWAQNASTPAEPLAQTAPAVSQPQHVRAPHAKPDPVQFHAHRMERVKTLLQLNPSQESAWQKYVEATRPEARHAQPRGERPDWSKLTTPERIEKMQQLRKERNAKIEQRENATKAFYASLNPAQQKAFDVAQPAHGHFKHKGKHQGEHRMGHKPQHHHDHHAPVPTGA